MDKETYDSLPEVAKAAFMEKDGEYVPKGENVDPLKNALANAKEEKAALAAELSKIKEGQEALMEAEREKARKEALKNGDIAAIKKDYEAREAALKADLLESETRIEKQALGQKESEVLAALASKSTNPELLTAFVKSKMRVEMIDNKATPVFLDNDGNATADNLEDFQKKLLANDSTKSIMTASNGSGSGAASNPGSGASNRKLSEMTATEEAVFANSNPEEYAAAIQNN